jgi:NADH dehydrogenase
MNSLGSGKRNIVIVGGGFAGTTLARALHGRLPDGYEMLLISEESYTTFNPMLPEAVGASVFPEQVIVPIRAMLSKTHGRFIMGVVTAVDAQRKTLTCNTLAGIVEIPYEHLVLAFGNRARLDMLPGMMEHSLPLKTAGDSMQIRNKVLRCLARIELETKPAVRQKFGHFVIIGGGFSGVEVAGALVDCLHSIKRFFKGVNTDDLKVTLLHSGDHLLPELSPKLGAAALMSLRERGVDVRLKTCASVILEDGVVLSSGENLCTSTVISTIGTQPNKLVERLVEHLGIHTDRGRIVTEADLSLPGQYQLWAMGDCALIPNAWDRQFAPPTAQFAVREAKHLANNIVAHIKGQPTWPFHCKPVGMMAAVGHLKGVALVMGIHFTGLPAWLLWRGYYLSQMPTMGRKLRIFGEWLWGMFFPHDITHFRFTKSSEMQSLEQSLLPLEIQQELLPKATMATNATS